MTLGEQDVQHLAVHGPGAVVELQLEPVAQVPALGVEHEGQVAGGIGGQGDRTVLVLGVGRQVVGGQAGEGRVALFETDAAPAGKNVAIKGLADLDQLLLEAADALAPRFVLVHAAATVVAQGVGQQTVLLGAVALIAFQGHQPIVDVAIQREFGLKLGHLLLQGLGLVAHGLVRVQGCQRAEAGGLLLKGMLDRVEGRDPLALGGGLGQVQQFLATLAGVGERGVGLLAQGLGGQSRHGSRNRGVAPTGRTRPRKKLSAGRRRRRPKGASAGRGSRDCRPPGAP